MAKKSIDISVGSSYDGSGIRSATADVAKFRSQLNLPTMGPLSREQSVIEDVARKRVRMMEVAGDRARANSRVDSLLFGSGKRNYAANDIYRLGTDFGTDFSHLKLGESGEFAGIMSRRAEGIKRVGEEAAKARQPVGLFFEMFRKFGTSSGTDPIIERLSKMAPQIGLVLAAIKAASIGISLSNLADDFSRHGESGNLERQLEDEKKINALKKDFPIFGGLSEAVARKFNLGGYRSDLIGTEAVEDQTKEQEARMERRQRRLAAEQAMRASSLEGLRRSVDAAYLAPTEGRARQRGEVETEYMAETRRLRDLQRSRSSTSPELQAQLNAEVNTGLEAAAIAHDQKLKEIERDAAKEREDLRRQHVDHLRTIEDAGNQADLERQGKYLSARLATIEQSMRDEIIAARRIAEDAKKNPDVDPVLAEERANREIGNIRARAVKERANVMEQERRETSNAERDHRQKLLEGESEIASRRLRLVGKNMDADKLELQKGYESRLAEIKANLDKEIQAHKEREPELRKQAAEDARAAESEYILSREELIRRKHREFLAGGPEGIAGEAGGLLRGTQGQTGMGRVDEMVKSSERTARAVERANDIQQTVADRISDLLSALAKIGATP